jgi:hypothetical protein
VAYQLASPRDDSYNCVAWALDVKGKNLWPKHDFDWPRAPRASSEIDEFESVLSLFGYERCESALWEGATVEKLAIYTADGNPEHIARQRPQDGRWTSKLGRGEDIIHDSLRDLPLGKPFCCENYGNPTHFYRRPVGFRNDLLARLLQILARLGLRCLALLLILT